MRISQLNACACCLSIHVRDALEADETQQHIVVLPAWRDTELFTDQERAALTLAESLVKLPDSRRQDLDYGETARFLSPEQLSVISWASIVMNAFNLVSIVSRHHTPPRHNPPSSHRDGDSSQ